MELELPPPPKLSGPSNGISSVPLSPTDTLVDEPTLQPTKSNAPSDSVVTSPVEDEKALDDSKLTAVQVLQNEQSRPPGNAPSAAKKYVLLIVFCLAQFLTPSTIRRSFQRSQPSL